MPLPQVEFQVAVPRDPDGVFNRLREIPEKLRHLLGRAEVKGVRMENHPILVAHGLAGLEGEENVVGPGILLFQVMAVVGRHQRQGKLPGELDQQGVDPLLLWKAVPLEFHEKSFRAEDLREFPGRPPGLLLPALKQIPGNLPFQAGRKPDQPLVVLGQNLPVNPGTVVETLKVRPRDQLREVAVTLEVPGQEHEMKRRLVRRAPFLVQAAPGRHVTLAADDGLDPMLVSQLVKLDRPKQIPVIGQGQGGELVLLRPRKKLLRTDGPIEKAVMGMDVQVDEITMAGGLTQDGILNLRLFSMNF